MATLTLTFATKLNDSLQVGDTAYYVNTSTSSTFTINSSSVVLIGDVLPGGFSSNTFSCNTLLAPSEYPTSNDYIFFTKDNKANLSSILGYYARANIRNNSTSEAELFQVSADYFESSK
tara:strand:- start:1340 stop:1696 length:357 start_codon:yes stop_codon:yes gene_type:complete